MICQEKIVSIVNKAFSNYQTWKLDFGVFCSYFAKYYNYTAFEISQRKKRQNVMLHWKASLFHIRNAIVQKRKRQFPGGLEVQICFCAFLAFFQSWSKEKKEKCKKKFSFVLGILVFKGRWQLSVMGKILKSLGKGIVKTYVMPVIRNTISYHYDSYFIHSLAYLIFHLMCDIYLQKHHLDHLIGLLELKLYSL